MKKRHINKIFLIIILTIIIYPLFVNAAVSYDAFSTSKEEYSQYRDYYIFEQGGTPDLTSMTPTLPYVSINYAAYAHTPLDDVKETREAGKEILQVERKKPQQVCIVVPKAGTNEYKSYYGIIKLINGVWDANGTPEQSKYNGKTIAEMCPGGFWTISQFYDRSHLASTGNKESLKGDDIGIFNKKYGISSICSRSKCATGSCTEDENGQIVRYIKHYGFMSYNNSGVNNIAKAAFDNLSGDSACSDTNDCKVNGATGGEINCGGETAESNLKNITTGNNNKDDGGKTITEGKNSELLVKPYSEFTRPAIVKSGNTYTLHNLAFIYLDNEVKYVELDSNGKVAGDNANSKYYEYVNYEAPKSDFNTGWHGCSENFKITIGSKEYTVHRNWNDKYNEVTQYCNGINGRLLWPTDSADNPIKDTEGWSIPILEAKQITDSRWKDQIKKFNESNITTREQTTYSQQVTLTDIKVTRADDQVFGIGRRLEYSDFISKFGEQHPIAGDLYKGGAMPAVVLSQLKAKCIDRNPPKKQLTCNKFEAVFTKGHDDYDESCAIFVSDKNNQGNNAKVVFKQKGVLKIKLNNRYIKSGESFSVGAIYEDTINIQYLKKKGSFNNNVKNGLKSYILNSELFKKFKSELVYDGIKLDGVWTYKVGSTVTTNPNTAATALANELINSGTNKGVKIILEFKTYEAWSNVNENNYIIVNGTKYNNYAGIAHIYSAIDPSTADKEWNKEGNIFYTRLDSDTNPYDINWNIKGLSAVNYTYEGQATNNYFWEAEYKCDIKCHQEFYDGGSGTGTGNPGFKFSYREIDSQNPFPLIPGTIPASYSMKQRYIGIDANWITWATAIGAKSGVTGTLQVPQNGLAKINTRINNRYSSETNKEADYIVVVDKKAINKVKNYNNLNNYYEASGYSKITKNGTTDSQYSKFLGSTLGQKTNGYGVTVWRNKNMVVNPVGTCGTNRGESIVTGSCFCMLADSSGNCIYNRNFTLD